MIHAISSVMQGLARASKELNNSAQRIASGDVSPESLVDFKVKASDVRVQGTTLRWLQDEERNLLDILA